MLKRRSDTTEELLAKSFKRLVSQYPVDKITVTQIADGAGVIRATFYNHFSDKYELLEWILIQEILLPVRNLVENGMIKEAMRLIFCNLRQEKEFYMQVIRMQGRDSGSDLVERGFSKILKMILEQKLKGSVPKNPWMTAEHIAAYYARSMSYMADSWVREGMKISPEDMTQAYDFMIEHSLGEILTDIDYRQTVKSIESIGTEVL